MAIWQYDFYLLPREEVIGQYGNIPPRLTPEEFNSFTPWIEHQPVSDFYERFTKWHSEFKSWHSELRWWGSEPSNRIDVWQSEDRVRSIKFRIELRQLDMEFIQLLVGVARDSQCVLLSAHTGEIVEPIRTHLMQHLIESKGANNVWEWQQNPSSFPKTTESPCVFLSHSSSDNEFVTRLAVDLKANSVPVWYDKWELRVGDSLSSKISAGIQGSGWLAVVLSKSSVASPWVERELNTALALELQKKDVFILPIVIDDCVIPPFLLDKLYADFRTSYQAGLHSLLARVLKWKEV